MASVHPIRYLAIVLMQLVLLVPNAVHSRPEGGGSPALEFIILHNNDMHSRFEQTSKYSTACSKEEIVGNRCYGGFARVSTLLKKYRSEAENGGTHVLFLNAGDTYTGTPWFTLYKDKIVAAFLNKLKPDAISLGNHELDMGVEGLLPLLNEVNFPVLVANLNNTPDHPLYQTRAIKKSVVLNVKGFKVGVIGYLTPETKLVAQPNDLEFKDEVTGINEEAEHLKSNGVHIIIALGHSGYEVDQEIAKNCPLVDVVIGGHSNTFLYNGEQPDAEKINGPYPTIVKQDSGKEVPVVQAYAYTKYMGELTLSFDADGNLLTWSGQPILLNSSIERDPDVLALLESFRPGIDALTKETLGATKVFLDGTNCRKFECNLGNLITDAMVYTNAISYTGKYWTDAGIALMQGGGIRASATIGNITKFDLTTILPFDNGLVKVNVTGKTLMAALERSVERYTGDRGEFLQMSGLHVVYNLSRPANERVVSAHAICNECEVPEYSPLKLDAYYPVIISTFIYERGDDLSMFAEYEAQKFDASDNTALIHYIHDFHTVYPAVEWRITLHGQVQKADDGSGASAVHVSVALIVAAVLLRIFN